MEHVSEIINRCKIQRRDGKTAYERNFGKTYTLALAEFGEAVHYLPLSASKADGRDRRFNTAEPRLQVGTFFGIERNSNEYWVGSERGAVVKSVTLRRLPITHQQAP